jgi:Ca2+-binding EF-hand superfamily protein
MLQLERKKLNNELIEVFKIFDEDGDGSINAEEFEKVCNMYLSSKSMTGLEIEEIIRDMDIDGDG